MACWAVSTSQLTWVLLHPISYFHVHNKANFQALKEVCGFIGFEDMMTHSHFMVLNWVELCDWCCNNYDILKRGNSLSASQLRITISFLCDTSFWLYLFVFCYWIQTNQYTGAALMIVIHLNCIAFLGSIVYFMIHLNLHFSHWVSYS